MSKRWMTLMGYGVKGIIAGAMSRGKSSLISSTNGWTCPTTSLSLCGTERIMTGLATLD
ncbi:MAG: hypothetical protein KAX31_02900 [Thermoplasmata archaeon]|nr:hypothetical protein [Thermoplasmata archaeon]